MLILKCLRLYKPLLHTTFPVPPAPQIFALNHTLRARWCYINMCRYDTGWFDGLQRCHSWDKPKPYTVFQLDLKLPNNSGNSHPAVSGWESQWANIAASPQMCHCTDVFVTYFFLHEAFLCDSGCHLSKTFISKHCRLIFSQSWLTERLCLSR